MLTWFITGNRIDSITELVSCWITRGTVAKRCDIRRSDALLDTVLSQWVGPIRGSANRQATTQWTFPTIGLPDGVLEDMSNYNGEKPVASVSGVRGDSSMGCPLSYESEWSIPTPYTNRVVFRGLCVSRVSWWSLTISRGTRGHSCSLQPSRCFRAGEDQRPTGRLNTPTVMSWASAFPLCSSHSRPHLPTVWEDYFR